MGFTTNHAIVVTAPTERYAKLARDKAFALGLPVTPPITGWVNDEWTFLVGPDGSKDGWDDSDKGDAARSAYMDWLDSQRYEDNSTPYAWFEAAYPESGEPRITRYSRSKRKRVPRDPTFAIHLTRNSS